MCICDVTYGRLFTYTGYKCKAGSSLLNFLSSVMAGLEVGVNLVFLNQRRF